MRVASAKAFDNRDRLATKADLATLRSALTVRLYAVATALAAGLGGLLVAALDRLP